MRKKYLSALLFGALLFASTGTFTSCKDYDDDINNLQEQINTVKTSLDELTSKINSLGAGVTDFKYENGQLVIVTDKGTNFTVDVADFTGITKLEIKDGILYADGEKVGAVAGENGSVVEVKGGVLYINGEAQDLAVGDKVVVKDNGDGTYTLTVGDKNYILPKGAATNISIKVVSGAVNEKYNYFTAITKEKEVAPYDYDEDGTGCGIVWGAATEAVDWTGPKGKVAEGQLLVGQTSRIQVEVTPAATQLDLIDWKLVDTKGNAAPVVVTPVAAAAMTEGTTGSRTVSANGRWYLSVAMDKTVTADNMGSAFTSEEKNKVYALQADGQIVSGYVYVIDTQEDAAEELGNTELGTNLVEANVLINGVSATDASLNKVLPIANSIELGYKNDYVYDYKFEIAAKDVNDCDALGITLENNVLKGITNAAAGKPLHFVLTVMGVDGSVKTYTNEITLTVDNVEADANELPATAYTVSFDAANQNNVVVDLGTTFSGLTSAEAVSLTNATWELEGTADNFVIAKNSLKNAVKYYSDAECKTEVKFDDDDDNIKNIKYAKITVSAFNSKATAGTHNLILTLKKGNDEVKKVKVPVTVSAPKFDDIFTKSAAWKDGVASLTVNNSAKANILQLYTTAKGYEQSNLVLTFDEMNATKGDYPITGGTDGVVSNTIEVTFDTDAAKEGNLLDVVAEVSYKVQGNANFTVKSGKFTIDLVDWFNEYSFVNYADDKAADITITASSQTLSAYADKNGIALLNGTTKYTLVQKLANGVTATGGSSAAAPGDNWTVTFDSNAGGNAKAYVDAKGNIVISGLTAGEYKTNMYVTLKSISNPEVKNTITVPVNVKIGK